MKVQINVQGIIDNLQNIAGILVGKTVCKAFNVRFDKSHRGLHDMFSHVSANLSADNVKLPLMRIS